MNHSFQSSLADSTKCARCKYPESDHGITTCEACSNTANCDIFTDMLLCSECIEKEIAAIKDHQSLDKQETRLVENELLIKSREIDSSIQTRMDLFNAATISIHELKQAIDSDNSIENKHFKLAEVLQERFNHFRDVIFEAKETQIKATNEQRAIQSYFNELSKKLREEERAKFKIQDINYQPSKPKLTKVKPITRKKFDKVELRKYASELGLPEMALQMIVVQKNVSVSEAADILRKAMNQ